MDVRMKQMKIEQSKVQDQVTHLLPFESKVAGLDLKLQSAEVCVCVWGGGYREGYREGGYREGCGGGV